MFVPMPKRALLNSNWLLLGSKRGALPESHKKETPRSVPVYRALSKRDYASTMLFEVVMFTDSASMGYTEQYRVSDSSIERSMAA